MGRRGAARRLALALALAAPATLGPAPTPALARPATHAVVVVTPDLVDDRYTTMLEQHVMIESLWREYGAVFVGVSNGRQPEIVGGAPPAGLDLSRFGGGGFEVLLVDFSGRVLHRAPGVVPRAVLLAKLDEASSGTAAAPAPPAAAGTDGTGPEVGDGAPESVAVPLPRSRSATAQIDTAPQAAPPSVAVDTDRGPDADAMPGPGVADTTARPTVAGVTPVPFMRDAAFPVASGPPPTLDWGGGSAPIDPRSTAGVPTDVPVDVPTGATIVPPHGGGGAPRLVGPAYPAPKRDRRDGFVPPRPPAGEAAPVRVAAATASWSAAAAQVTAELPDLGALPPSVPQTTLARARDDALESRFADARRHDGFESGVLAPDLPLAQRVAMRFERLAADPAFDALRIEPLLLVTHSCGANVEELRPSRTRSKDMFAGMFGG